MPIENGIKSLHAYVALWAALCVGIVLYGTFKLSRSVWLSISVAAIWAFSFSHWKTAEIIEVYTMNSCLSAAYLILILFDQREGSRKRLHYITLLLGLCCWVHIQGTLLFPVYVFYLWRTAEHGKSTKTLALSLLGLWVCLSPTIGTLWLPEQSLKEVFFGGGYQNQVLNLDPKVIIKGFGQSLVYLIYNFWLALIPFVFGLKALYQKERSLFYAAAVAALPTYFFSMRYIVSDNYVFFLPSYLVIVGIMGFGLLELRQKLGRVQKNLLLLVFIIQQPLAYMSSLQLAERISFFDEFKQKKAYKGGLRYYLWPGMKDNVDILSLSKNIYLSGKAPDFMADFDWQYAPAIEYLRQTEGLPAPPPTEPELLYYENLK